MDSYSASAEQNPSTNPAVQTFSVHFSAPSVRLSTQPQPHWKLAGAGEVTVEKDRVVLRGLRPRPFRSGAQTEIPIPLNQILNVVREGAVIQCHVRDSGTTKVLRLWAANEQDAERLTRVLPTERTPDFERLLAEHQAFNSTLSTVASRPVVTQALLILNCAIFACTVLAGAGLFNANGALLVHWGTNFGPLTLNGEWWRLFTSMFLHFGLIHLAFNMWALWSLGLLTERLFGSAYFLVLYIFAGICGSLLSLYWHPNLNSAGASGAIFGVLGGLLAFVLNPKTRVPASIAAAQRNTALIFIAYNLFNGLQAGIDNAAHIGGLLGGFAMGWALARPVDVEARQDPLPRLATVTALGAMLLVALSWPLFHSNVGN
jgi:rhomboid protease GluP